jgi:hypothetical protein
MLSGVSIAGVQRPFVLPNLLDYPNNEGFAGLRFERLPTDRPVGLIHCLSECGRVAGWFSSAALSGRRTALQLVCDSGRGATDGSRNGSYSETLFDENFNGASLLSPKMLSLLALCFDCDIILVVHSDCPPLGKWCVRTPFYHEDNHYGFFAKCPTSFYNQPFFPSPLLFFNYTYSLIYLARKSVSRFPI